MHIISYKNEEVSETTTSDFDSLKNYIQKNQIVWFNFDTTPNQQQLNCFADEFGFHKLALEDVVSDNQRAKMEIFGDHLFIITRMLREENDTVETEQLSMFVGRNYLVSFQQKDGDPLEPVRERIRKKSGKITHLGSDYLIYRILDRVVEAYFPVLERIGEELEELDEEIVAFANNDSLERLHTIKRKLLVVRKAIWPMRELLNSLIRDNNPVVTEETRIYLRDVLDQSLRIMELVESYRELTADIMSLYVSMVSHRMNEIIKVLTIISTIFIPLTFIVGVYGMNFDPASSPYNMPELKSYYGYPSVMGFMLLITLLLLAFFKKKRWI